MNKIKSYSHFINESEQEVEEFHITDIDEIEGHPCKDFKVKELKKGDKIFRRLVDVDENEFAWAKDVNEIEVYGMASHSKPTEYEVVEVGDKTIKLK